MKPLKGIKAVDLSRLLPGPYASALLSDYGAEVICVESEKFRNNPPHIHPLYRNKKHICLDLKNNRAKEVFYRLVKDSDILIEGFRPGVAKKLGIDYDYLKTINKKIIYCSITGFGQNSKFSERPGHDVNYLSLSGILDQTGEKKSRPLIPGIQIADIGGALFAVNSILAALFSRERTKKGAYIDISLAESAFCFGAFSMWLNEFSGIEQKRGDSILSHRYSCYDVYETKDKKHVSLGCLEPHFWVNFLREFNLEKYIDFQFDDGKKEEIRDEISKIFLSQTRDYWEAFFQNKDVCFSAVKTTEEAKKSDLFKYRFSSCEAEGRIFTIASPVKNQINKIPGFGENTEEILEKLGYHASEIKELLRLGITGEKYL